MLWLIESAFGDENELPADLCAFMKKFLGALATVPLAWPTHLVNLFKKRADFIPWKVGAVVIFIGIVMGIGFYRIASGEEQVAITWEMLGYLYLLSPVIIVCALLVAAGVSLIVDGINYLAPKVRFKRKIKIPKPIKEPRVSILGVYLKSVKEKYCVRINYVGKDQTPEL